MNKWKIWFGNHICHTLNAMKIEDVIRLIPSQDWNQDIALVTKIELIGYE